MAFTLGDKLGRKKSVSIGITCNVIGAVLQITAFQLPQMIIGRVVNGFGMGLTSSTCPVYQAECSKPNVRGKLVVLGSLSNTAAFCLSNWMNYGLFFEGSALQWRFPLGFQLIFPLVVTAALLFTPESPRWLMLQDRHEEALAIIARLEGKGKSIHDPEVTSHFLSIQTTIQQERKAHVPAKDVFFCRDQEQTLRRLLLACGTQLMQQFSGVNALGYYLPTLLQQSVGLSEETARLLTGVNGTIYLFAACCCLLIIDRFGRRKMMLYGTLTMGSCYLIASICLKVAEGDPSRKAIVSNAWYIRAKHFLTFLIQLGRVTTSMFFMYYFFYGTSLAKVPWVFNSEVSSLAWRTRTAAAATGTNWICGFAITQFTKKGVNNLGWGFYLRTFVFARRLAMWACWDLYC